jgi:tRNA1Val (adenine37-N6)-methyltransferase
MDKQTDNCELFGGAVEVEQYIEGYRFSIDSVLLARWARIPHGNATADVGAGCGIISIILAAGRGISDITALELQDDLSALCLRNVKKNGMGSHIKVKKCDVRQLGPEHRKKFNVVLSNPPFREIGSGRLSAGNQKAIARHELTLTLDQLLTAVRFLLKDGGKFNVIYPMRRFNELSAKLPDYGFYPSRIREVQPRRDEPANLVLLEATLGGGGDTIIEKPLIIFDGDDYTDEVAAMYEAKVTLR